MRCAWVAGVTYREIKYIVEGIQTEMLVLLKLGFYILMNVRLQEKIQYMYAAYNFYATYCKYMPIAYLTVCLGIIIIVFRNVETEVNQLITTVESFTYRYMHVY